jgi:hypothetical protein
VVKHRSMKAEGILGGMETGMSQFESIRKNSDFVMHHLHTFRSQLPNSPKLHNLMICA